MDLTTCLISAPRRAIQKSPIKNFIARPGRGGTGRARLPASQTTTRMEISYTPKNIKLLVTIGVIDSCRVRPQNAAPAA